MITRHDMDEIKLEAQTLFQNQLQQVMKDLTEPEYQAQMAATWQNAPQLQQVVKQNDPAKYQEIQKKYGPKGV